jgi:hypothetical protein
MTLCDHDISFFFKAVHEFLKNSKKLCELEALTFLPDDKQQEIFETRNHLAKNTKELKEIFIKNGVNDLEKITEEEWRLIIGMTSTFSEWCDEIGFFDLDIAQQEKVLQESPLVTFSLFLNGSESE